MNARRRLLVASFAAVSLPAFAASREVRGSGRVTSERRHRRRLRPAVGRRRVRVELRQGSSEGVELTGDDDLLPLIETVVEDREGARHPQDLAASRRRPAAEPADPDPHRPDPAQQHRPGAAASRLKASGLRTARLALSIGGSGDIALTGLDAERLAVNIGGSGRVTVDGRSPEAVAHRRRQRPRACSPISPPTTSRSRSPAAARADVRAERRLKVTIAGSGRVRHSGAAVPTVTIVGSGDLRRL